MILKPVYSTLSLINTYAVLIKRYFLIPWMQIAGFDRE